MRIATPSEDAKFLHARRVELGELLGEPLPNVVRPCPGCELPCPSSGSLTCACHCSRTCPHAPREMSSEPDEFPIEPGIVPLVFALYSLRQVEPCWSCEGHVKEDGTFWRLPQAWFYCRSQVLPRIIADAVSQLRSQGVTQATWIVNVTYAAEESLDPVFAIRPDLSLSEPYDLRTLRRDVEGLADGLLEAVRERARHYLKAGSLQRRAAG
ncbi:MAG: hypothetical protein IIB66_04470 [Proteobacteria bacterium]|nr:hypothetical protein [Pseudomonadota bacterium]